MVAWISTVKTKLLTRVPTLHDRISIAKSAVSAAGIKPDDICAVLSTGIDVYTQPSDSVAIACGIGAHHALTASVNNSCASFSTATDIAIHQLNNSAYQSVLVTGSSAFAAIERNSRTGSYANGVGAAVITNKPSGLRIVRIEHQSDANYFGLKTITFNAEDSSSFVFTEHANNPKWPHYRKAAITFPVSVLSKTLERAGWSISEIDYWALHQSELTRHWESSLGISSQPKIQNMGNLTSMIHVNLILNNNFSRHIRRIAVLEIGLGMTVGVMLLKNGER
jgi:3-oxoacyl-[acyl-carrier-protein] synthase III